MSFRMYLVLRIVGYVIQKVFSVGRRGSQLVTAFILRMPVMASHPYKFNLMGFHGLEQALPKVYILNRLVLPSFPALLYPFIQPVLGKSLDQILRVGVQVAAAR